MPWDASKYQAVVRALGDQGYRRVDLSGISPDVSLGSTGDAALDSALIGARQTPNWGEVARQILQFSYMSGFQSVHIRRDRTDFELVVLQAYNGQLALATADKEFGHAWPIVDQLGKFVQQFALSERTRGELQKVLETWGQSPQAAPPASPLQNDPNIDAKAKAQGVAPNPTLHLVLAILSLIWDVASSRGTTAVLLEGGGDGLAPDMTSKLENAFTPWQKEALSIGSPRTLSCVGLDCLERKFHGHTELGSLNLGRLNDEYRYYLDQAA